jgi:putative restriction endonuclease
VAERDESLRVACFAALDVLRAEFGDELPLRGGLDRGIAFQGTRVPFFSHMKGIFRAGVQRGPAALAVQTSWRSPYADAAIEDGFLYAYRSGASGAADNRALRAAYELGVPIVYFVGTRPGYYEANYPFYVTADDAASAMVKLSPGAMVGPLDEREAMPILDEVSRRYATREVKVRLHQGRFRAIVLPAYRERCAICRLKEVRLLDAAHITGDALDEGAAAVNNGISLCTIHHRAFDQNLVGVSPDYHVRVSSRLLDEEDGPMLDLLKQFHDTPLNTPSRAQSRPDPDRLSVRYERFLAASS